MKAILCVGGIILSASLTLALLHPGTPALAFNCATCVSGEEQSCAASGGWIVWCAFPVNADLETTATDGAFEAYSEVKWCDTSVGTTGAFEVVSESSDNIQGGDEGIAFDPAYFFPSSHCEVLGVTITGDLDDDGVDGSAVLNVWKWPPNRSDTIGFTVFH